MISVRRSERLSWCREFYATFNRQGATAKARDYYEALMWTHLFIWAGWEL